MRHTIKTTAALAALVAGATPQASAQTQPAQPPAVQSQPGQAPQGSFVRPESQGRPAVPAGQDYSQAMDRLFQSAQRLRESVQAMAQQPAGERRNQAMAQAREALMHTQQALTSLPSNLRTSQTYRDTEQRVGEARSAIEGAQPDAQRAQVAADAIVVLVPRLRSEAEAGSSRSTGASAAAGGAGMSMVPLQRVSNLPGTDLIGPNGQKVGEIENLLVDREGNVRAVVVEWGGFLGIGEREAMVPIESIQLGAGGDDRARINMTREQLEALPRWNRNQLDQYSRQHGWGDGARWYR